MRTTPNWTRSPASETLSARAQIAQRQETMRRRYSEKSGTSETGSAITVPLTIAVRRELRAEIKRTGTTSLALFKSAPVVPDGLTASVVNRWLSGIERSAQVDHLEFVLSRYRELPDAISGTGRPVPASRLPLTPAMRADLEAEFIRTCASVASILEPADNIPPGLNARIVRSWIYGEAKSVCPVQWSFVMARLSARPDGTGLVFSRRPDAGPGGES